MYIHCITPSRSFLINLQDLDASEVSKVIRLVILGEALPVYAVVGAGGLWLHGSKVSANVLQEWLVMGDDGFWRILVLETSRI